MQTRSQDSLPAHVKQAMAIAPCWNMYTGMCEVKSVSVVVILASSGAQHSQDVLSVFDEICILSLLLILFLFYVRKCDVKHVCT